MEIQSFDSAHRRSRRVHVAARQRRRAACSGHTRSIAALVACCVAGCIVRYSDFAAPLVGNYQLLKTSADQVTIVPIGGWSESTPTIPSKVVEVAFDDRFILAKRQHLKRRPNGGSEEPVANEFDFWILDTGSPKAYGPFDEAEFGVKSKEFGISDQIQLRDANSLSPYWRD
jgi:hypothetical protein